MTDDAPPPRVERALRVLPDLPSVAPLRALLMSLSRRDGDRVWASAGPYLTVGKQLVRPGELQEQLPALLDGIRAHLAVLYEAAVEAFDAEQRGDFSAAAAALLRAAQREESQGRLGDARQWCEAALPLSAWIGDRHREIDILLHLGRLCLALDDHTPAARHYQRAFALAEAAGNSGEVIPAARGLGSVALAREDWSGARAWFSRALLLADADRDVTTMAVVQEELAMTALRQGALGAAAEHLVLARDAFEPLGAALATARVANVEGLLAARLGHGRRAVDAYRESLAWIRRVGGDPDLEATVRLNLAALHVADGHYLDAEEEARRTERLSLRHGLTRRLVEAYTCLGRVRGHQHDEMGFVFFEQALELCRVIHGSPALDGEVYCEYAAFRDRLGQPIDARELLERARECFAQLGDMPQLERVRLDLQRRSA